MSQITVNVMINMVVEQHRWRYTLLLITTACLVVQLSNEKEHDLYCFVLSLSLSLSPLFLFFPHLLENMHLRVSCLYPICSCKYFVISS